MFAFYHRMTMWALCSEHDRYLMPIIIASGTCKYVSDEQYQLLLDIAGDYLRGWFLAEQAKAEQMELAL